MRLFLIATALLCAGPAQGAQTALERAMDAELKRAAGELRQEGYPPAYYVSLTATDVSVSEFKCSMGALLASARFQQRLLLPDLRVGGYELDNHPLAPTGAFLARPVGLDEDEFALRHGLWRMLDESYKAASADFLRKQAMRLRRGKAEYDTDDLTRETPRVHEAAQPPEPWKSEELKTLCVEASRQFRARPGLLQMEAGVKMTRLWSRLRDSEGSRVDFGRDIAEVQLDAVDLSTDGLRLYASRRFIATSRGGLPDVVSARRAAREMMKDLDSQKSALSTAPFNAPALIDPSVAAAVVLAIGSRLTGEEERNPGGAQIFRDKLGKQVLPEDLSLIDDPTLSAHAGELLAGAYAFDSQGVTAQRVVLVEKGRLKNLLLSRFPVVGAKRSNGHARGAPGVAPAGGPGSLFLRSERPAGQAELLNILRRECRRRGKPYGIWVRKLRAWSQQQGTGSQGSIRLMGLVYLVEAKSGRITLVRDLDMVGTPLALMENILKAGDDVQVHSMAYAGPVSVVVPSLLLQDVELQRSEAKPERAPVLPPPPVDLSDVPGAVPQRVIRVPTFPAGPHVKVVRYIIRGKKAPAAPFVMEGLLKLRQSLAGDDLVLDAKLGGKSASALVDSIRAMDASVDRLAGGLVVEKSDLAPVMTRGAYEAQWGRGWPQ
jgi:predicted Zn-dependent protease